MRFQDERFRRSEELYSGAVISSLGAAFSVYVFVPAASAFSATLVFLGLFLSAAGLYGLDLAAYDLVRDTKVWKRLLQLQAGAALPDRSLELEAKMLTATIENLETTPARDLVELRKSDLLPAYDSIVTRTEFIRSFLHISVLAQLVVGWIFLLQTFARAHPSMYHSAILILVLSMFVVVPVAGLILRRDQARRFRVIDERAHSPSA